MASTSNPILDNAEAVIPTAASEELYSGDWTPLHGTASGQSRISVTPGRTPGEYWPAVELNPSGTDAVEFYLGLKPELSPEAAQSAAVELNEVVREREELNEEYLAAVNNPSQARPDVYRNIGRIAELNTALGLPATDEAEAAELRAKHGLNAAPPDLLRVAHEIEAQAVLTEEAGLDASFARRASVDVAEAAVTRVGRSETSPEERLLVSEYNRLVGVAQGSIEAWFEDGRKAVAGIVVDVQTANDLVKFEREVDGLSAERVKQLGIERFNLEAVRAVNPNGEQLPFPIQEYRGGTEVVGRYGAAVQDVTAAFVDNDIPIEVVPYAIVSLGLDRLDAAERERVVIAIADEKTDEGNWRAAVQAVAKAEGIDLSGQRTAEIDTVIEAHRVRTELAQNFRLFADSQTDGNGAVLINAERYLATRVAEAIEGGATEVNLSQRYATDRPSEALGRHADAVLNLRDLLRQAEEIGVNVQIGEAIANGRNRQVLAIASEGFRA